MCVTCSYRAWAWTMQANIEMYGGCLLCCDKENDQFSAVRAKIGLHTSLRFNINIAYKLTWGTCYVKPIVYWPLSEYIGIFFFDWPIFSCFCIHAHESALCTNLIPYKPFNTLRFACELWFCYAKTAGVRPPCVCPMTHQELCYPQCHQRSNTGYHLWIAKGWLSIFFFFHFFIGYY